MTMQNPASLNPFGWDLVCTNDMTPDAAECGGTQVLANALYRRATSPRGCLIYDLDYGYDLNQFINIDIASASDIAPIGAGLDAEFLKDPRVYSSVTIVTFFNSVLTTSTTVTPSSGPTFTLVLAVSSLNNQGVQILNVTAQ
jgi:hypothetical protein